MNAASAGKWSAIALFLFVAVLVIIAAMAEMSQRGAARSESGRAPANYPFAEVSGAVIPEAVFVDPTALSDGTGAIASVDVTKWTHVDPTTGEVEYEITARRVDPEAGGRIVLTEPRALVFLGDGVVRIAAESGSLIQPRGQSEPESGELRGGVTLEIFDEIAFDSPSLASLDGLEPSGVLRTETLSFETALGQIESPDEIVFESPGVSFVGRGLLVRVGELERGRRYRLNMLRIEESGGVRIRPSALASSESDQRDSSNPRSESDADATADRTPPPIDFYRARIQGGVDISHANRRLTAERLDAFARLFGGKLAEDAVARLNIPRHADAPEASWTPTREDGWSATYEGSPERRLDPERDEALDPDEEIVISWGGALEVTPEMAEPAELLRDDVFVKFSSPREGSVSIADADSGATARCATLMYGLTSARLLMTAFAGDASGVTLEAPGAGGVSGESLELELGDLPRGVVRMRSPGVARAEGEGAARDRRIRWGESAEIGFELAREDEGAGALQVLARSIELRGDVEAIDAGNRVEAEFAEAQFRDAPGSASGSVLASLLLRGEVRGATEDGGTLEADVARVSFESPGDDATPIPTSAKASGAVRVARAGDWMTGEHLDAWFAPDEKGRLRVRRVEGATGVAMGSARGFGATTEVLRADLDAQTYELSGDDTEVTYDDGPNRYALQSNSMRIDGATRTLVSFGSGAATYTLTPDSGVEDTGRIAWQGSMFYDDLAGAADIMGDVVASRVPGPLERQHAEADRVLLRITPWTDDREPSERRVVSIDLEGAEGDRALLELRRYRADRATDEAALETLIALRSETVAFDAVGEVLNVPQAGLLLVEDRRRGEVDPGASAPDASNETEVRGTTAFQWEDSLRFDRATGQATMKRGVRVRHLGLETGRLTQLECETLGARFRTPGQERDDASPLLGVVASDGVFLRHGTIEVVCDALDFDATSEEVQAMANPGNRVTVLDSGDGRHFTAGEVVIDLRTGEWRAKNATGVRVSE